MASELQEAKKWIVNLLKADPTLQSLLGGATLTRVYADRASFELGFPRIIVNTMSGVDVQGLGTNRIITNAIFQIRLVSEGAPDNNSKTAEARMDSILQTQVAVSSGGFEYSVRRIAPIDRTEYDEAKKPFSTIGGLYRVWVTKV